MTIIKLKEKHPKIYDLIVKERFAQGNYKDIECDCTLDDTLNMGNFNWEGSNDGVIFWESIWYGNYDIFYEKYPKFLSDNFSII